MFCVFRRRGQSLYRGLNLNRVINKLSTFTLLVIIFGFSLARILQSIWTTIVYANQSNAAPKGNAKEKRKILSNPLTGEFETIRYESRKKVNNTVNQAGFKRLGYVAIHRTN